jgi:hypothetical protein
LDVVLYAFGHCRQAEGASEREDPSHQCCGIVVSSKARHEALVDLDHVDGEHVQVRQRRVPRPEVVYGQMYAKTADCLKASERCLGVPDETCLGYLQGEKAWF